MTEVAVLSVPIEADQKQFDAALKRIEAQGAKVKPVTVTADTKPLTAAFTAAERQALSFAQARARLLAQGGDLAGAERIIASALQNTTASTTQTVNAQRQLLQIQQKLAAGGKGGGLAAMFGDVKGLASNINGLVGTVAGLGGAFAVVSAGVAAVDFARTGASIDAARQSFDNLASSAGTSGKALLSALNQAAAGTVAQTDLIKSSNTALLLLGSDVASKLPQLLAVAKASATSLGTDVGQVFDSLVTGISRGSTELIDNAGITVKAAEAYASYAASIGKSADSLSASEKQQAILNAVLEKGGDIIAQTSGGGEAAAATYQRMDAALANLTATAQVAAASGLQPLAEGIANTANAVNTGITALITYGDQLDALNQRLLGAGGGYEEYRARVEAVNQQIRESYGIFGVFAQTLSPLSEEAFTLRDSLIAAGEGIESASAKANAYQAALNSIAEAQNRASITVGAVSEGYERVAASAEQAIASNAGLAPEVQRIVDAFNQQNISAAEAQSQLEALAASSSFAAGAQAELLGETGSVTGALQDQATAATDAAAGLDLAAAAAAGQEAALRAATQAAYEQANAGATLEQQARAAAQALVDAGGAGASAAAQLGNSTAPLDQLTAAYYRLYAAQQAVAGGGGAVKGLGATVKGAGEATAAIRALNRVYGAGPLAPRSTGSGAGGGGGGTKKTEAQKLAEQEAKERASLYDKLTDIEQNYYEGAIAAERNYQEKVTAIQKQYAEKQLEAQRDLARQSSASRADFYESLINTDLPADVAQSLSAAYEQAFAEAQQMAQSGNADMADEYLALKQKQLDAERQYQEKVAALADEKDKKKAANEKAKLDAIKALRDQQYAVEEAQLREQGGSDAAARDAALADAAATRDEALAKAQLSAQDALAAAERRKGDEAKITNEQLAQQLRLVQQITQAGGIAIPTTAGAGAGAAASGTAAPASTPAPATAAAPAAAGDGGPLAVNDAGVIRALERLAQSMRARGNSSAGG